MLGADYSIFTSQRKRLQELYRTRFGEVEVQASLNESPPAGDIEDGGTIPTRNDPPIDVYSNPLEPGVVAQRSRELKKPTGKKQKSKQNAPSSQGSNQPSRLTDLSPKARKNQTRQGNKSRATSLKNSHPSLAHKIPRSLSKQAKTQLLKDFKAAARAPKMERTPKMERASKMAIKARQDRVERRSRMKQATSSGKSDPTQI
ncbi:MAG: hypothetical protein Q9183_002842 [Haloplaca sp. 2 TL-2023]